jgi:parallel beta-helix repeat protein
MRLSRVLPLVVLSLVAAWMARPASANTLCVNPSGSGGCYVSISAAIAAASPGDTIQVAHGTYAEFVVVPKSLSLVGENEHNTTVEALNKPFGIYVDGYDNPGLSGVAISGFTVENASNAGIAVSNASNVTISDNIVQDNDHGLVSGNPPACPSLADYPYFFGEAADCGEGIFFSGVDHSTVADNTVTGNAGGMLITDDTGATHNNVITGNSVERNTQQDCGITIPSHSGEGVYQNTVSDNDSSYNGGPGVGIFAPGPGSKAYANVVIHNTLRGNGLPGVTMHNHAAPGVDGVSSEAPPVVFNDNVIVGNDISENSQDTEDAATAGPTGINIYSVAPMTGTLISQNVIREEQLDIVTKVPAVSVPAVQIHFNNFPRNDVGVQNAGTAQVDATQNWWGCSGGPGANGCATISGTGVLFVPWLKKPFQTGLNY